MQNLSLKEIRARARGQLRGKWGKSVLMLLTYLGVVFGGLFFLFMLFAIFAVIASVMFSSQFGEMSSILTTGLGASAIAIGIAIYVGLILCVYILFMGVKKYFNELARGNEANLALLFWHFTRFWKTAWVLVKVALAMLLYMIPYVVFLLLIRQYGDNPWLYVGLFFSYIGLMYASLRYAFVPFVLADYSDQTAKTIIKISTRLMKGNMLRLIGLGLTICWSVLAVVAVAAMSIIYPPFGVLVIVCIVAFYIALLWLLPYLYTAMAVMYQDLLAQVNHQHAQMAQSTIEMHVEVDNDVEIQVEQPQESMLSDITKDTEKDG
ncbi:MAG: DUF975 family protein [Hyphomonadaceae bacterium]|nr:DUF975 family protein [Clostridia bacterium]